MAGQVSARVRDVQLRVALPWRRGVVVAALLSLPAVSCGTPNPRVTDSTEEAHPSPEPKADRELSEPDKIRKLLSITRTSQYTFTQDGQERDGAAAAADMERRLARTPAGIPTARQFVERVGAGRLRAKEPDTVRLDDGTVVPTRDWLLARLADLEGNPIPANVAQPAVGAKGSNAGAVEVGILDALMIVERSRLRFVAPPRRTSAGKIKGKRKEYSGPEFAEMLRKKWEFLGADIHDLDTFIQEIATDSFASFEPYRVIHGDGHEEEFRKWLLDQIDERRAALAKGG